MQKNTRSTLLKVLVTAVILAVLVVQLDLQESWNLLKRVTPLPLLMAFGLMAASHMVVALVWRRLLEEVGISIGVERAVRLYYSGLFMNNFLLGSAGGDTYRVYSLFREGGSGNAALAGTFLERLIGVSSLMILGVVAVLSRFGELPATFRLGLLLLMGGGILFCLGLALAPGLVRRLSGPLVRLTSQRIQDRVVGFLEVLGRGGRPGIVGSLMLVVIACQAVRIWTNWWCAYALGLSIDPVDLFVAIPLVAVAAALPISIGGLGVREGSSVLLLAPLGIAGDEAVAMIFLGYLVVVATSLFGGAAFLFGKERVPSRDGPINEDRNNLDPVE